MLRDVKLSFIGTGTMASAMIGGLLSKGMVQPTQLTGSDPRERRCDEMQARYGLGMTTDNRAAARAGDIVVLSVKPQVLLAVMKEMRGSLRPEALVLSIVAGARTGAIASVLDQAAVVRSMPNTPAQIGMGMTVWTATPAVSERQREQARAILQALGKEVYVDDEKFLDMATAVSGTGPTYAFLMMEALIDAAVHLGFSRETARDLVVQTMIGSAHFAEQSDRHVAELRNMVTSPGGTSAEALYQLEKGSLRTVLSKAVWAAYQRSVHLGDMASRAAAAEEPAHGPDDGSS